MHELSAEFLFLPFAMSLLCKRVRFVTTGEESSFYSVAVLPVICDLSFTICGDGGFGNCTPRCSGVTNTPAAKDAVEKKFGSSPTTTN